MLAEPDDRRLGEAVLRRRLAEVEARLQAEIAAHAGTRAEKERCQLYLDQLFAHMPIALAVVQGPDLRVVKAYAAYHGWIEDGAATLPHDRLLGHTLAERVPGIADSAKQVVEEVLRTGVDGHLREIKLNLVERRAPSWWDIDLIAMHDAAHGPCILLLASDVTEHVLARRRLRELVGAQQRYRTIAETIPFGIWMSDAEGKSEYVSQSMLDLLAMTQEQALGYGWMERMMPEDRELMMAHWRHCVETGQDWEYEHHIVAPDGVLRTILSRGRPVRDESGAIIHWVGINLDMTERVRMERQLRELNAELDRRVAERTAVAEQRAEQLRRLASELTRAEQRERRRLARVLHDHLQQLLVGAKLNVSVLQRRMAAVSDAEPPAPGADCHDAAVRRTMSHVDDLLDQAIAASRSLTAELSPSVLYDMGLPAALEWLGRSMADRHGLYVEVEAADDANPRSEDLRVLLYSSARELLLNVIKHAGVQEARMTLRRTENGQVQLTVSDEGVGFGPAHARGANDVASGLGLFSIQERIELLGGQVQVRSEPGSGTGITLTAPLSPPDGGRATTSRGEGPLRPTAPPSAWGTIPPEPGLLEGDLGEGAVETAVGVITVLLADDHAMVRRGLSSLLDVQPDMHVVAQAMDGQEALEMVREFRPDVVVMDVTMPRLNGVEATQAILAEFPKIRVIGMSMHDDQEIVAAMLAAGAAAYLTKSGPPDDLLATIRGRR